MPRAKPSFPPPKALHILSVVQIVFASSTEKKHSMLKVDVKYLNQKLMKLQKEGMTIVGIYFTDLDKEPNLLPQGGSDGGNVREYRPES